MQTHEWMRRQQPRNGNRGKDRFRPCYCYLRFIFKNSTLYIYIYIHIQRQSCLVVTILLWPNYSWVILDALYLCGKLVKPQQRLWEIHTTLGRRVVHTRKYVFVFSKHVIITLFWRFFSITSNTTVFDVTFQDIQPIMWCPCGHDVVLLCFENTAVWTIFLSCNTTS